jgi:hypothetical protein
MITLSRDDFNAVSYSCETEEEDIHIEECLTLTNEGAHFSEIYQKGKWDGKVRYYKNNTFPYGFLEVVVKHLTKNKILYQYISKRFPSFETTLPYNPRLHEHQVAACKEFFKHLFGIVIVPTRGGKTYLASETIRHILHADGDEVCLFIVDTEDLYNQARKEISSYLGIHVGGIRGDEFDIQPVTVATIQTIQSISGGLARFLPDDKMSFDEIKRRRGNCNLLDSG